MKTVSMSGSARQNVGKKDAKALRREGKVPCVLYGGKEEQVIFACPKKDFTPLLFSPDTHYVKLNIEGKEYDAILQDIQYHPVSDEVLHADFLRISDDKPLTIAVPVKTVGVAPGVLQGGKMTIKIRKIKLHGLPQDIPQTVDLDISGLNLNQNIKVGDIKIDNVSVLDVPTSVVVWVRTTRNVVDDTATTTEEATTEASTEATAAPATEEKDKKEKK